MLTSQSVKFRPFGLKNVSLCCKSNGKCLACIHPIQDALGQLREHLGSQRCSRHSLEHLLRYLRAIPAIRVHSEWDGRTLDIVHSLTEKPLLCALSFRPVLFSSLFVTPHRLYLQLLLVTFKHLYVCLCSICQARILEMVVKCHRFCMCCVPFILFYIITKSMSAL